MNPGFPTRGFFFFSINETDTNPSLHPETAKERKKKKHSSAGPRKPRRVWRKSRGRWTANVKVRCVSERTQLWERYCGVVGWDPAKQKPNLGSSYDPGFGLLFRRQCHCHRIEHPRHATNLERASACLLDALHPTRPHRQNAMGHFFSHDHFSPISTS